MNKEDILIRLLKEGHISDEEFKFLYVDDQKEELMLVPNPWTTNPPPFNPFQPFGPPYVWHGINDPNSGQPLGPTFHTQSKE